MPIYPLVTFAHSTLQVCRVMRIEDFQCHKLSGIVESSTRPGESLVSKLTASQQTRAKSQLFYLLHAVVVGGHAGVVHCLKADDNRVSDTTLHISMTRVRGRFRTAFCHLSRSRSVDNRMTVLKATRSQGNKNYTTMPIATSKSKGCGIWSSGRSCGKPIEMHPNVACNRLSAP